jgi:hypothetical protein
VIGRDRRSHQNLVGPYIRTEKADMYQELPVRLYQVYLRYSVRSERALLHGIRSPPKDLNSSVPWLCPVHWSPMPDYLQAHSQPWASADPYCCLYGHQVQKSTLWLDFIRCTASQLLVACQYICWTGVIHTAVPLFIRIRNY